VSIIDFTISGLSSAYSVPKIPPKLYPIKFAFLTSNLSYMAFKSANNSSTVNLALSSFDLPSPRLSYTIT